MKEFLCLILLVTGCLGQELTDNTGGTGGTPSPIREHPANVTRPCRRYDLQCVRNFFNDHSHCRMASGEAKEPVLRFLANQILPAFNLTITTVNGLYSGFNRGRVGDLYINRETDKVVLTIEFSNLTMNYKDTFIEFLRRAREPILTHGYVNLVFPSLTATVTIPQVDNLRLDMADVFGYLNEQIIVDLDPKLGESSDPLVPRTFRAIFADLQTSTSELLITETAYYAALYIQNIICDFGLELL